MWLFDAKRDALRKAARGRSIVCIHVHTNGSSTTSYRGSDGFFTAEEMALAAKTLGIHTLVISDHSEVGNKRLTAADLCEERKLVAWAGKRGVRLVFGIEQETEDGHILLIPHGSVLKELPPRRLSASALFDWARERGVYFGVPHPLAKGYGVGYRIAKHLLMKAAATRTPMLISLKSARDLTLFLSPLYRRRIASLRAMCGKWAVPIAEADAHRPHELCRVHFVGKGDFIARLRSSEQFDPERGSASQPLFNLHFMVADVIMTMADFVLLLLRGQL